MLAVGAWALLRGRLHGLGIASRRAAAGVAAAGLVVTGVGGSLAPAAESEPLPDQVAVATTTAPAPTTSRPSATRPARAATTTTAAPTTTTPALPPAPVMAVTCPGAGSGASPVFGQQISATGPYRVTIDYGDGDVYTNDDQHLSAVFSHRFAAAGTFMVQAVLTDVAGQTASASCSYTWTAPAPFVGSTGGSGGGAGAGVGGGSSTGGGGAAAGGGGAAAGGGGEPYYQNCDAVRAAGAAPIHPGDPGFQQKFDRDNDGVGCE